MRSPTTVHVAVLLLFFALLAFGARGTLASDPDRVSRESTLVGQLLLPPGAGSRGIEVLVRTAPRGGEPRTTWVLFDEAGRFTHTFHEALANVVLTAGQGREVDRVDAADLPEVGGAGQIDLGVIDLRDRLMRHRLVVRAADGLPPSNVRVAMWFGPPPVGPEGEPVSLGSRQFPPVALGSEMEWLVPHGAQHVYFLVEQPAGSGGGTQWRSGQQRLFGPFEAPGLPDELIIE